MEAIIAGGQTGAAQIVQTTDIYEASTKVFAQGPMLSVARRDATASVVNGTQLVVVGGRTGTTVSAAVDVFSGPTLVGSTVSPGTSLATARYGHTANVLSTGQVLVIGGFDSTSQPLASIETVTAGGATATPGSTATGTTPPATQGVPMSITPVPSTAQVPAAGASNSTGSLVGSLVSSVLGSLLGLQTGGNAGLTPNVTSITPNTGAAGTIVVIQATGIGAYLSVAFDDGSGNLTFLTNTQCTAYQNGSSVQLTFTVPSTLPAGSYKMDLITSSYSAAGSPAAMAQTQFTKQ
jgi:hypothetical protein